MIIIKLKGGLGNQMFQYAFGKNLAVKLNSELILDLSAYRELSLKKKLRLARDFFRSLSSGQGIAWAKAMAHTNQRQYELRYFELDNQIAKLAGTNLPVIQEKQNYVFEEELLIPRDDHAYEGYFNSAKYFSEIADTIRTDFRLKPEYESTLPPDLLSSINNHCSVSIHVRRGDYATKPTIQSYHGICGLEYYEKAITEIIGHTTQPQFFIFSDDIKWCRENIQPLFSQIDPTKNIPEPIFVSGLRPYQDLILMSRCRHQIIANSTFSWWAAWLNNNPDKIVIAPQSWLKDKNSSTPDLLPPEWLKI